MTGLAREKQVQQGHAPWHGREQTLYTCANSLSLQLVAYVTACIPPKKSLVGIYLFGEHPFMCRVPVFKANVVFHPSKSLARTCTGMRVRRLHRRTCDNLSFPVRVSLLSFFALVFFLTKTRCWANTISLRICVRSTPSHFTRQTTVSHVRVLLQTERTAGID